MIGTKCPKLTHLSVRGCVAISDEGIIALPATLTYLDCCHLKKGFFGKLLIYSLNSH